MATKADVINSFNTGSGISNYSGGLLTMFIVTTFIVAVIFAIVNVTKAVKAAKESDEELISFTLQVAFNFILITIIMVFFGVFSI